MCDCDFLPHYFIWSTEDTQQLYPNCLVGSSCVYKSVVVIYHTSEHGVTKYHILHLSCPYPQNMMIQYYTLF